ncbi:MAG: phosphoribosylglycinamide formyltransferase [Thermoplasmataceae archaeon]|jgi:phosphoribosylglycinamide formyltransferase-1
MENGKGSASLVVLASGEGTNLQAIINAVQAGELECMISAVISDVRESRALERARLSGIPAFYMPKEKRSQDEYSILLRDLINSFPHDFIVLAGFLKILSRTFIDAFPNRIINIHPSLLPCFGGKGFYGEKVHRSVIESGARISGCTVHFVTADVDLGPIIDQESVVVQDNDTPDSLAQRIHPVEHMLLIRSIRLLVSGKYKIIGKRVIRS